MGAAQRDFSGACTAEWVRAKNAARRVRPAAVANFPRAESAIGTAGGASSAPVSPNFPRAESAFASGKDYGFRASRAAGYLPVATKFHGAFCMGAAQRDSPSDCAAEWVRAKPRFAGKGNAQAQSVFGKGKNLQWRGTFRRFQRSMRRLRGAKSRICSAIMAQKTLKLQFRRVSNTLQRGPEQEAPNGSGPKRRWDPGFEAA